MDVSTVKQIENTTSAPGARNLSGDKVNAEQEQFGQIWKDVQAKYGAKAEKPREIKKTLGKDDFMRLMITQMKNQDPTQPFKAEQFASELAQYASVEQLQNINQQMGKMANQNQPLERLAMTGLIGKEVTIDRERFPHTEGTKDVLAFQLPRDADDTRITVQTEAGEPVFEKDLGPLKKGENTFDWDGLKANSLPSKSGSYVFRIEAKDPKGATIQTNPQTTTRVVGVSFEGQDPVLLVGDLAKPEKILMRNVIRVDDTAGGSQLIPGAQPLAAYSAGSTQPASGASKLPAAAKGEDEAPPRNMFTFERGQGSRNIDPSEMAPASGGPARVPSEVPGAKTAARPEPGTGLEGGFPNGLKD